MKTSMMMVTMNTYCAGQEGTGGPRQRQKERLPEKHLQLPVSRVSREGVHSAAILQLQRGAGNAAVARMLVQRQHGRGRGGASEAERSAEEGLSDEQADAAVAWSMSQRLGEEAIRELQRALGAEVTGTYDVVTANAVYHRQRQWQPRGRIAGPGKATPEFFFRLGLISTHTITAAGVGDSEIAEIRRRFPNGVTVAIYADYGAEHSGAEFLAQARIFARNQGAVGVTGGSVAVGVPVPIKEASEVIEIVQSIHRGLLAKEQAAASAAGGAGEAGGEGVGASAVPLHTRIKNLALFSHGESWGMGLEQHNRFQLHSTQRGLNPPNIAAFVRGIRDAVTDDVGVQLFACLTGHEQGRSDYDEWTGHRQGEHHGAGSFAETLATELGGGASVYGHTTAAHTTENFAARVFGAGGAGGAHMFDVLYPEAFIQSELQRLFSDKTDEECAELHDPLREQMWAHYKDSITGEHGRRQKRYPVPIGQEMFVNPAHARELVQADFTTWVADRLSRIRPPQRPRPRAPVGAR